jgi:hypothetical protein
MNRKEHIFSKKQNKLLLIHSILKNQALYPLSFSPRLRVAASAFGRQCRPMADEGVGAKQGGKVLFLPPGEG